MSSRWCKATFGSHSVESKVPFAPFRTSDSVFEATVVTVVFNKGGISGNAGCNSYDAGTQFGKVMITVDTRSLRYTERACVEVVGLTE